MTPTPQNSPGEKNETLDEAGTLENICNKISEVQVELEKLPASEQQTKVSAMLSIVRTYVQNLFC